MVKDPKCKNIKNVNLYEILFKRQNYVCSPLILYDILFLTLNLVNLKLNKNILL